MHLGNITHVGMLLADGRRGDFTIELESLSAFRYTVDEYDLPHVRQALELNRMLGYEDDH